MNKVQWKEFWLSGADGIFQLKATASGIDGNKLVVSETQNVPYISRSDSSNGIKSFVSRNQQKKYKQDCGNCITIGLDTQTVFYQPHSFFTGQNIQVLRNEKLTENVALFLVESIRKQMDKFNWGGNGATLGRLSRIKIMLPVDESGEPNFAYMESTIEDLRKSKFKEYRDYISKELSKIRYVAVPSLDEKEWMPFSISSVFEIESGCDIYDKDRKIGNIPYITSSAENNGIKYFISNMNPTYEANIIAVNRNGSVGYAFYHKYPALFSNDCRKLKMIACSRNNEAVSLFMTAQIMQQKEKYNYSLKMGTKRLSKQKIMLPVDSKGNPDYPYMEQYVRNIFYKKYKDYLDFKEKSNT